MCRRFSVVNLPAGQPRQYPGFFLATWMMLGSHRSRVYGPVPAVWSRSQPSALSPPLSLVRTAVGLTMSRKRRPARNALLGLSRWKTIVVGFGVSTFAIGLA